MNVACTIILLRKKLLEKSASDVISPLPVRRAKQLLLWQPSMPWDAMSSPVIMKGKRMKPEWLDELPQDIAVTRCLSENGWINEDLFLAWGEIFIAQLPKDGLPHLLFMDGHGSHVYNIEFMQFMQQHNVLVWCFSAHTTHWL